MVRNLKHFGQLIIFNLSLLFVLVFAAKGISGRPVSADTPLLYFKPTLLPLVSNTPLTFAYSIYRKQEILQDKHYYSQNEVNQAYPVFHQYDTDKVFKRKNVVVFIMESFARDYIMKGNKYKAVTPFLDFLVSRSLFFDNAYSNGVVSSQGIVSILASIPPLMNITYYLSPYNRDSINGVGTLLNREGYDTNFFMGAGPDHFSFGKFCKIIGIQHYYSMKDYGDDRYYDGNWGIFDEQFMGYMAKVLDKKPQPFFSALFTISAHYPFTIPKKYRERFNYPGQSPAQNSISYVDYSFRKFFEKARKMPWFKNTIFIFSADHWRPPNDSIAYNPLENFKIPIIIYSPGDSLKGTDHHIVSQIDIIPTFLQLLHYHKPFFSFGHSMLDSTRKNYSINITDGLYQLIGQHYILGYNAQKERTSYFYAIRADTLSGENLAHDSTVTSKKEEYVRQLKLRMQQYNYRLIHNKMSR